MRTIAVCNLKGGVGKTTTTLNLGACLARSGQRVLVVDCDPQAHLSSWLGIPPEPGRPSLYDVLRGQALISTAAVPTRCPGLRIVPSSPRLTEIDRRALVGERVLLARLPETDDVTLLDCPASPGIVMRNALMAAEELVVPVQAKGMAVRSIERLVELLESIRLEGNPHMDIIGILVCMFDARTRIAWRVLRRLRERFGDLVFDSVIHEAVDLSEAADRGLPIIDYRPGSRAAREYEAVAHSLARRSEEDGYFRSGLDEA